MIDDDTLAAYATERLTGPARARVEAAVRDDPAVRERLATLTAAFAVDEHSVAAIWSERQIGCPTEAELRDFVAGVGGPQEVAVAAHVGYAGCERCAAVVADLRTGDGETARQRRER
ncbi:MAG: hypothetical protein AAGJ97_05420, partial [Planctomycetota bacterium]